MTLGWEFLLLAAFCWTFLDALQLSCLSRRFLTAIYETNKSKKCSTLLSSMGAFLFGYGLLAIGIIFHAISDQSILPGLPLILLALFSQFGNQQPHSCWPPIGASNVMIMFSGPASFLLLGVICLLAGTFWSLRSNLSVGNRGEIFLEYDLLKLLTEMCPESLRGPSPSRHQIPDILHAHQLPALFHKFEQ
jgi:hypothetical protein